MLKIQTIEFLKIKCVLKYSNDMKSSIFIHYSETPELGGPGGHVPPKKFGILVNPIWTKEGRLCPPYYYWAPPSFWTMRRLCCYEKPHFNSSRIEMRCDIQICQKSKSLNASKTKTAEMLLHIPIKLDKFMIQNAAKKQMVN